MTKLINNGKLITIASNSIGGDPHVGVVKKLSIKYKHKGIIITKVFKEHDEIILP